MTPSEIVTKDAERIGYDADVMLRKIDKLVTGKAAILLQENNTILLLISIAKGVVESHLFTADNPKALFKSLAKFWNKVKQSEIRRVYTDITNPSVLEMSKRAGWNVQPSNMPRYNGMAVVKE